MERSGAFVINYLKLFDMKMHIKKQHCWPKVGRFLGSAVQCVCVANPPVMNILYLPVNWEVATAQKVEQAEEKQQSIW